MRGLWGICGRRGLGLGVGSWGVGWGMVWYGRVKYCGHGIYMRGTCGFCRDGVGDGTLLVA